mgnify:CR=1 FL=1
MVKQVEMTVGASPDTQVFVYRNMIKALPWFTSVREKITKPEYAPCARPVQNPWAWPSLGGLKGAGPVRVGFMNFSKEVIADHNKSHVPVCVK